MIQFFFLKKLKKRNSVRGQPWHETDRATHLVEQSSVDFNEEDIDIYNRYKNMADRDTNLVATSLWCNK